MRSGAQDTKRQIRSWGTYRRRVEAEMFRVQGLEKNEIKAERPAIQKSANRRGDEKKMEKNSQ